METDAAIESSEPLAKRTRRLRYRGGDYSPNYVERVDGILPSNRVSKLCGHPVRWYQRSDEDGRPVGAFLRMTAREMWRDRAVSIRIFGKAELARVRATHFVESLEVDPNEGQAWKALLEVEPTLADPKPPDPGDRLTCLHAPNAPDAPRRAFLCAA